VTEPRTTPPNPGQAGALVLRVRRRARATLAGTAWLHAAAWVLAAVLVLGMLDYVFRLPRPVRVLNLLAMAWGLFELGRRVVAPAMRFSPGLAEVALRIERSAGGPTGSLASGVEFGRPDSRQTGGLRPGVSALTEALARAAADEADAVARRLGATRFVRTRGLGRAAALLALVGLVCAGSALARPDLAAIGLARTLWPLGDTPWPTRTALADATTTMVHPLGEALQLRALLTRTHQPLGRTDVAVVYRVLRGDEPGPTERAMLTSQQRFAQAGTDADPQSGELFERLIEPGADLAGGELAELEYWFETEDNRTEPRRIVLAERPAVERITAGIEPPGYARGVPGSFLRAEQLEVSPDGAGVAAVQPILAGSAVELSLTLSKPARRRGGEAEGWSQPDPRTLRYRAAAGERTRLEVALIDDAGLEGAAPLAIALEVVADQPAGVTIVEPAYDESVLATAVLGLAAEGKDDFGMRWLALERQTARPPAESEGAAPEPAGPPVSIGRTEAPPDTPAETLPARLTLDTRLALSTIGVRPGDEVWVSAVGRDVFTDPGPGEPDTRPTRSTVRRLRIIDESAFINQLRGELAGVRRAAIEIDAEQTLLRQALADAGDPAALASRQAALTERLDAQRGALERLTQRTERNALGDETLAGMLTDAGALLGDATESSAGAATDLESAAAAQRDPADNPEIDRAQARVRDDLATLISMLDQGQDNWVARRTVESLLDDQRALAAETGALGDRTMGQSREQLSAEDLTELERIAARQQDAAERAAQALDSLTDRAESLERVDSAQAGAMSRAARRGRQERLDEQMRQASAQVRENQTRAAAQGQQAAIEALEQMLEDIDSAEATRDQALRRVLASVLESLESLIAGQEAQIEALGRAREEPELVALAGPMVALAGNTLGLIDEIGGQRDLASIAPLVAAAADAQERAVAALREASVDSAAEAEDESLARLRQARDEAERMDEAAGDRENSRKRAELRRAYRGLLEQQVAIADDTLPWLDAEVDRRARAQVRALGQRQQGLSDTLAEIRRATAELADAAVFDLAHRRLDQASKAAADALLAGEANAEVARRQATIVRVLRSLVEAMAEQQGDQRFGDQQNDSGSGGGGAGGGQEPPIIPELAELKLLRAMQAEAMEWTRNLDEAPQRPAQAELAELAELQQELATRAGVLVEKLTQPQGPTGGEGQP